MTDPTLHLNGTCGRPCAGEPYIHDVTSTDGPPGFRVECGRCGNMGPERPTEVGAITAWNTRQSPAPADVAGLVERLTVLESFLRGSGELDGLWFGDKKPMAGGRGEAWWWRHSHLGALAEAAALIISQSSRLAEAESVIKQARDFIDNEPALEQHRCMGASCQKCARRRAAFDTLDTFLKGELYR